ncbi:mersacidin/lichenicidin family type 2 lantibiotic [Calothrix membranacea FACHB-236]|nr:mersacidin/lichenicidin family type 2 lantibiotic [Calothrix membranacea FACHB-236]
MSQQDIIRAWKDREYRESLSEEQRSNLPENPAGIAELSDETLETIAGGLMARGGDGGGTGCGTGGNCSKCNPCSAPK